LLVLGVVLAALAAGCQTRRDNYGALMAVGTCVQYVDSGGDGEELTAVPCAEDHSHVIKSTAKPGQCPAGTALEFPTVPVEDLVYCLDPA